jgi:predicted SAM-dependent methyltransferase
MTIDRFSFQRECALKYEGTVLNVGCNEDPASLGTMPNVVNCDNWDHNPTTMAKYPVDNVFDCTEDVWPFEDDSVDLVIFGDIIEHFYPEELARALKEARRVARNVCATLPYDERIFDDGYFEAIKELPKGAVHVFAYKEQHLRDIFRDAGFSINRFDVVDYGFVPMGYFLEASRSVVKSKPKPRPKKS